MALGMLALASTALARDGALSRGPALMYVTGMLAWGGVGLGVWAAFRVGAKRLIFAALPVLCIGALVEVGLRVYAEHLASRETRLQLATPWTRSLGDAHIYTPHHYSVYGLNPEVSASDGLAHNALGFRDARALGPDPSAFRIVLLGGSTTYTIGIRDNEKIFSSVLERGLNARYRELLGPRHIEVVNAGLGGATSAETLIRLVFFVSEIQPDVVVLQHGINDVWPRSAPGLRSDYGHYRQRWRAPSLFHRDAPMAYSVVLAGARLTMVGNFALHRLGLARPWHLNDYATRVGDAVLDPGLPAEGDARYFRRNSEYIVALAREMGARVLLATVPFLPSVETAAGIEEHNEVVRRIARQRATHLYDFAAEMPRDELHLPDGLHVSQRGSDRKAQLYLDYFERSGWLAALIRERGR